MPLFPKKIPVNGRSVSRIISELERHKHGAADWKNGRTFSLVFYAGEEGLQAAKSAYDLFFSENALNPSAFPGLKEMEMEVVSMVAGLTDAPKSATGTMTSGGTESILMAVKSCREWFFSKRAESVKPNMIVADSAHPAFEKAAHYFGIDYRVVPVNDQLEADPAAMEAAVDSDTMMIVASAVSYPFGILDPVESIAKIAKRYKLWMHVDACIGGMVLAFCKKAGHRTRPWNFKVRGVSSMSVDLHKYGYAAKGASVVLYRNRTLRRFQFFVTTDWPGGIYASPSLLGTRPGGAIAAAWAVMHFYGLNGYSRLTKEILENTEFIKQKVREIPELYIIGNPEITLIAIGSDTLDIFHIADYLSAKGWYFDRCQSPPAIHLTIGPSHSVVREDFITDLEESVNTAKEDQAGHNRNQRKIRFIKNLTEKLPGQSGNRLLRLAAKLTGSSVPKKSAAMYGMMGELPDRKNIKEMILDILDKMFERR